MKKNLPYKRVLLKISGEMLMGTQPFGISHEAVKKLAMAIKEIRLEGFEIAIVIGGGNIFRGLTLKDSGFQRTPADQMGMLSTLINGLALQQTMEAIDCKTKIMTALECPRIAEAYNWEKALAYLKEGTVLLFVGGTGNPYFTTDTAAAMRASEIGADILLKATKVDGIYDKDPIKYVDAVKYDEMSYSQVLAEKLEVMDATAISLCGNNKIPIFVFNMQLLGKTPLADILTETKIGTIVRPYPELLKSH